MSSGCICLIPMTSIKIGTFNVKGIRDNKKRRKIFQHIHQRQFDIICLEETHSQVEDEQRCRAEWGDQLYFPMVPMIVEV